MAKTNPSNHSEQIQKLQEIGANLCQIRTERGISLDAIAQKTAIAKRILIAIEQAEVDRLPEPFYTKALIKKYAMALGVTDLPDYTAMADSQSEPIRQTPKWFDSFRLHSIHLYLLYLFIVVISVRSIAFNLTDNEVRLNNNETLVQSIPENQNLELTENSTSLENNTTPSQLISRSNNAQLDEVIVDVDLKDRCWMKVIVDGKVIFEGILPAGTHRTWKGKQQVTIVAGNAGGVAVTYNHGTEKLLGEPGQVQEVTYSVN